MLGSPAHRIQGGLVHIINYAFGKICSSSAALVKQGVPSCALAIICAEKAEGLSWQLPELTKWPP